MTIDVAGARRQARPLIAVLVVAAGLGLVPTPASAATSPGPATR